jgi:plastocyanin
MNMRALVLPAAVAVLVAGSITACISDRVQGPVDLQGDCSVPLGAFGRGQRLVVIRDFAFLPDTVRIARAGSVTWANCEPPGTEGHTIVSAAGTFASPLLQAGGRFTQQFESAGVFEYTCGPHPHMRAVVIVE